MTEATLDIAYESARLRLTLSPKLRFFAVSEAPINSGSDDELPLYLVSFYLHELGLNHVSRKNVGFIVSNTFLGSHAYNIALCRLFYRDNPDALIAALRHNFKKVFAECTLHRHNCLMGRALLVETVMFEQGLMRPVFDAVATDPRLAARATALASVMQSILGGHELGHHVQRRHAAEWREQLGMLGSGAAGHHYDRQVVLVGDVAAIETGCDMLGCWSIWGPQSEYAEVVVSPLSRLRLCAFAFLAFAELFSLQRSGHVTADASYDEDATIALGSERRTQNQFTFAHERDVEMDRRTRAIVDWLADEALAMGGTLFGDDDYFPLPDDTPLLLRRAFAQFADHEEAEPFGLTGTDLSRRGLAQMLAESLHGHDEGVEHLLWRSKRFSQGGRDHDP